MRAESREQKGKGKEQCHSRQSKGQKDYLGMEGRENL